MDAIHLPKKIGSLIGKQSYTVDDIGQSGKQVLLFETMVLKIEDSPASLERQVQIMQWSNGKIPTPRVLAYESENGKSCLLMSKMNGKMACDRYYLTHPIILTKAVASGLKMLWEVDTKDCPQVRDLDTVLKEARYQVENRLVDLDNVEPTTFGNGGFECPEKLLDWLERNRPSFEPVFSHGDYTLPNIFLENGQVTGFIDLDKAGVGDKWNDIALCYRSLKLIYEAQKDITPDLLFEELGIEPDWEKIRYYLLLDELF